MDSIDGFSVPISLATILFCLSGFTLLALVIAVLRGYEIYHRHFRLLLIDLLLPFMIVDTLHALRSVMGLLVHLRVILDPELMLEHFVSGKPDVLPAPLCVVVSTSVLLICMERLYATFNYQKYETEDFAPVLSALCKFKAVRLCSKLDGLSDYSRMLSSDSREQDEKQKDGGIQALLKEDGHLVLTTIFELVLLVILLIGLQVNREHEGVYIRHYYSSLSQRFQIGENVKGIQLMATFTAMLAVSLVAVLAARYIPHLRLWDGLDSLALPTFTIAFPLCMLRRSQVMRSRARILARESLRLVKRPLAQTPGASLMKVGNETIHSGRVLQEYWDDHLE